MSVHFEPETVFILNQNGCSDWTRIRRPHVIRSAIAQALDMEQETIMVEHRENAGCYGHYGADDAAMDVALLALRLPNRSIMLHWQRPGRTFMGTLRTGDAD